MKNNKEIYEAMQAKWIKLNKIKPGSRVKVVRKDNDRNSGWGDIWVSPMDECVGKVIEVSNIEIN